MRLTSVGNLAGVTHLAADTPKAIASQRAWVNGNCHAGLADVARPPGDRSSTIFVFTPLPTRLPQDLVNLAVHHARSLEDRNFP